MWPFNKSLEDVLFKGKKINVLGIIFRIKKIDPTAYLDGSKSVLQEYDIYKVNKSDIAHSPEVNVQKLKEHYKDVFLAAVIYPKLKRKAEDVDGIHVDNLFTEWDLCHKLYEEIMLLTYGKKKLKLFLSQKKK